MKYITTSLIVAAASLLLSVSAIPASIDAGITTFISTNHTLTIRKVPEFKPPWSAEGTCNVKGSCTFDKSGALPARCRNSTCDQIGAKCIVAYSDTAPTDGGAGFIPGREAKCPTNTAGYEWEWPWIDHAKQGAWESYKKCKSDAKGVKDKDNRKEAIKSCDEIHGGLA